MVKIIYNGYVNPGLVRAGNETFNDWYRGEVREISDASAKKLLANRYFSLADKSDEKNVEKKEEPKEEINLDLNNDGVVDSKDFSIAGKVLSSRRRKKDKGGLV